MLLRLMKLLLWLLGGALLAMLVCELVGAYSENRYAGTERDLWDR